MYNARKVVCFGRKGFGSLFFTDTSQHHHPVSGQLRCLWREHRMYNTYILLVLRWFPTNLFFILKRNHEWLRARVYKATFLTKWTIVYGITNEPLTWPCPGGTRCSPRTPRTPLRFRPCPPHLQPIHVKVLIFRSVAFLWTCLSFTYSVAVFK